LLPDMEKEKKDHKWVLGRKAVRAEKFGGGGDTQREKGLFNVKFQKENDLPRGVIGKKVFRHLHWMRTDYQGASEKREAPLLLARPYLRGREGFSKKKKKKPPPAAGGRGIRSLSPPMLRGGEK